MIKLQHLEIEKIGEWLKSQRWPLGEIEFLAKCYNGRIPKRLSIRHPSGSIEYNVNGCSKEIKFKDGRCQNQNIDDLINDLTLIQTIGGAFTFIPTMELKHGECNQGSQLQEQYRRV